MIVSDIDVRELLDGDIRRAAYTTRYSRHAILHVESVAEHTFNTMAFCSVIAMHLTGCKYELNLGLLLSKALWHDIEEPGGTGDILREVKHSSPEMLGLIETIGRRHVVRLDDRLGAECQILKYWSAAKDDTLEGQIVRVADLLSVVSYLVGEYRLGNRTMVDVNQNVLRHLDSLYDAIATPEMQDLVRDVKAYFVESVELNTCTCPVHTGR